MIAKKIIISTISYVVLSMAIAYPWHIVWFHDAYARMGAVTRAEPIIPLGMLTMVIQGIVIAYLYPFYYRGGNPVFQGVKFTFIIGLLIYSVMGLAIPAKMNIEPIGEYLAYHTVFQTIQFLLTGAALGMIYGRIDTSGKA